ncbi:MAG: phosphatidylglycerol lysyltransferase domain-containing protein [Pseudoflavonifractor sp.]|nr:phosphatidylglycerol lysyltransferase domain-containing protein [Pseudoflavonifractor sp.]
METDIMTREGTSVSTRRLLFKPITMADMPAIRSILNAAPADKSCRTCDFTVAGIYMWIDYFYYQYCIVDGTLFIKGVTENDVTRPAFSVPVGPMPLGEAMGLLSDYCREHGTPLRFSAVPEGRLADFLHEGTFVVEELTDWADYLYPAAQLATLSGKAMNKKRNHVNRFMTDNPNYTFEPITPDNIDEVRRFMDSCDETADAGELAEFERGQVDDVINRYGEYGFEGALLRDNTHAVVAFTIGEVIGDTLYVHIEKMTHEVAGAGETINKLFAAEMVDRYGVCHINREEDVGDVGLRKAKMSYHPEKLLKKYNMHFLGRP